MRFKPRRRNQTPEVVLFSAGIGGHHAEYATVLANIFRPSATCRLTRNLRDIVDIKCTRAFFEMLDDRALEFLAVACLRSLFGLRTAGLFFRASECFHTGLRYRVKFILFYIISSLPHVRILTILPFEINPRFARVASGWIYDPQLWDLSLLSVPSAFNHAPLAQSIRDAAHGRKIVIALGAQDRIKGFEFLVSLWCQHPRLHDTHLVVVAGKVSARCGTAALRFAQADGLLLDRFLDSAELRRLYQLADLVWCCYAPDYDQSSGIFGRAFQIGVPAVIRRGSYLEGLALALGHPTVVVDFNNTDQATTAMRDFDIAKTPKIMDLQERVAAMQRFSVHEILFSLGLPPPDRELTRENPEGRRNGS